MAKAKTTRNYTNEYDFLKRTYKRFETKFLKEDGEEFARFLKENNTTFTNWVRDNYEQQRREK